MPKLSDKERVGNWDERVARSSRTEFEPWEKEYDCDMLECYYYGRQHNEESAEWDQRKYVINLFYPSINISKPSLLFHIPKYRVTPNPVRLDDPLSDVQLRAKLQEDTLQTEVNRKRLGFPVETGLAILDAQFRFGVVQIGYSADYIDNPNADKPILIDGELDQLDEATGQTVKVKGKVPMTDSAGNTVTEAKVKLKGEGLYMQWIPAKQFRVGDGSGNRLSTRDWSGYYKWVSIQDLKQNPRYKNTSNLKASGRIKGDKDQAQSTEEEQQNAGKIKTWFIWDHRAKQRMVFQQGGEKFFLEESYKFLPFSVLKFDERPGHFYPLPPTYNWVHPQNELNDTREMQRIHRKRAKRRFGRRPSVTEEEFAKLESGEDFTCIVLNNPESDIFPIPDAPLDPQIMANLPVSHEDFTRISGISGESQQVAQSETATQANLIAVMGQTRESAKRLIVAEWLSDIGRIMLMTLHDKMALPFWIKVAVDPASPLAPIEKEEVAKIWKQVTAEELGDIENDISVDITSLSPIAREQERTNWMTFLGVVTSPTIGLVLSKSPTLLRKTAGLFDIRSEAELREVSNAMEAVAMMFAQAQAEKAGVQTQGAPAPGPTPTNSGIQDQLMAQMPVERLQ